jgi:hypothetical protein
MSAAVGAAMTEHAACEMQMALALSCLWPPKPQRQRCEKCSEGGRRWLCADAAWPTVVVVAQPDVCAESSMAVSPAQSGQCCGCAHAHAPLPHDFEAASAPCALGDDAVVAAEQRVRMMVEMWPLAHE